MITLDNKYVMEISEVIKNLLTFCKFKVETKGNEITLHCSKNDCKKVILFFKRQPII